METASNTPLVAATTPDHSMTGSFVTLSLSKPAQPIV